MGQQLQVRCQKIEYYELFIFLVNKKTLYFKYRISGFYYFLCIKNKL
jgi:hypothetical protein